MFNIFNFFTKPNTDDITIDDIKEAQNNIKKYCYRTPLIEVDDNVGTKFYVKCENLQRGGAFKIRGAINMIEKLSLQEKEAGVVTFSSGNHGLALSLASSLLDIKTCVVCMPTNAPVIKKEYVLKYGGEVIQVGTTTLERKLRAESEMKERSLTMVPPFDHKYIMCGQGTIGLEIVEECPLDKKLVVYVPCSGGGLIGGISYAIKSIRKDAVIIGVEPITAPKMTTSLHAGKPTTLSSVSGIADGLLSVRPGDITFKYVQQYVDSIQTVTDTEIAFAVKWLFDNSKLVSEPSGSASVACALKHKHDDDTIVVAIISGGNVTAEDFAKYINLKEGDTI